MSFSLPSVLELTLLELADWFMLILFMIILPVVFPFAFSWFKEN